jgi:hypothetical protein
MVVGSFVDTKQEAKILRRELDRAFPRGSKHHYCKTKQGYYYVWADYPIRFCERKKPEESE